MNRPRFIVAMLITLALAVTIPVTSLAEEAQPGQPPAQQNYGSGQQGQAVPSQPQPAPAPTNPAQAGPNSPQPKGGVATVIGVDQPENCLRIRSGPGSEYDIIGCAGLGQQLDITGVWTSNDWAQTAENGWVFGPQIETDLRPPSDAYSQAGSYTGVQQEYPVYYGNYADSYLPDYGYYTYSYGGVPLFLYNVNVWRRFHPWWWWHKRHWNGNHRVWNQNQFNRNAAIQRGVVANRAGVSSANVQRFNANTFRSRSANAGSTGSTNLSTRNFATSNAPRARTFSNSNTFRARSFSSPNFTARSFSRPNFTARSFSGSNSFRMGSMGMRSFSAPHMGGGGGRGRR